MDFLAFPPSSDFRLADDDVDGDDDDAVIFAANTASNINKTAMKQCQNKKKEK